LAETTHLSLTLQRVNDSLITAEFQEAFQSLTQETLVFVNPLNSSSVAGYTIIEDAYGEPCLILRVYMPRTIYAQGQTSIFYFVLLRVATGLTFSIVIVLLLEKLVLSRLAQLSANVSRIRSNGDPSDRVSTSGNDEMSDLADEINKMLTKLEQSQGKLRMLNEKLTVVGSLTRHDLRNKLSIITSNVYLAKQKLADDPDASEFLETIESTIDTLEKIFDFARTYEKVGLEDLSYVDVEKSVNEAAILLGLEGVELVNECKGLTVLADSLLRQLFYNMIDNTLWHGKMVTQIRVYHEEGTDHLKLVYEDNGVGVPEDEKELIFKEGYGKSTGYGLYLIRNICKAYGWTIKETGEPGKGAQFTMTIPKQTKDGKTSYKINQHKNGK
jgi:signal transduction histidine kinase